MAVFIVFITICCLVPSLVHAEFSYENQDYWGGVCHSGLNQSPIGLYRITAIEHDSYTPLKFIGYDAENAALIQNNGHTVKVRLTNGIKPTVMGGGLPEHYTLDHLHFHWDSEHTIDDFRFPLEMHMVHYATTHGTFENATRFIDGLAVFAVLFDASPDDDDKLRPFIDAMRQVRGMPTEEKPIERVRLTDYMPRDTAGFFRYQGSLTTPGCNEVVVWTVFTNTLHVSHNQIEMFKLSFKNHEAHPIAKNFRELQPVNGRIIYKKVSPLFHDGASTIFSSSAAIYTLSLATIIVGLLC